MHARYLDYCVRHHLGRNGFYGLRHGVHRGVGFGHFVGAGDFAGVWLGARGTRGIWLAGGGRIGVGGCFGCVVGGAAVEVSGGSAKVRLTGDMDPRVREGDGFTCECDGFAC